jgi:hypothetical protein
LSSLCSIPWQDDFPGGNVATVKDALRFIHWKLDDRPISMELYEFAAFRKPVHGLAAAPNRHANVTGEREEV